MLVWLIGLCLYCDECHTGQWSRLYRIGCLCRHYLLKWYQIRDPHAWMDATYVDPSFKIKARMIADDYSNEHNQF